MGLQKVWWTKMVQNGQDNHFCQNHLIGPGFLCSQDQNGPKWSILAHLGPPTVLWPLLIFKGLCTNYQNLEEQQNTHHQPNCTGDVHHGFVGVARIVGFEDKTSD